MQRYFIHLAYNGKNYFGWQRQPKDISVQEVLENDISVLLKEPISIVGAGRTDTGVHARNFYAHFDTSNDLNEQDCQHLAYKLNAFLPKDIVVFSIFKVDSQMHARFSATSRTYRYYVSTQKNPFRQDMAYSVLQALNVEQMNECCQKLLQYNDFTSFSKVHTQTNNNLCTITFAQWQRLPDNILCFEITANRFLRNMVRAIVGTLLQVGKGKLSVDDFCRIIEQRNRNEAGESAPAHALFLEEISYQ
ncbi:MAG: tRNA pseudouridine(38-40) synthase TruA [Bacteroidales bacterium]|nr:tRNA pseudouridine(38-40) synthase TruA [Bacteroidales bacterium]